MRPSDATERTLRESRTGNNQLDLMKAIGQSLIQAFSGAQALLSCPLGGYASMRGCF
jgi:hypothetical protein